VTISDTGGWNPVGTYVVVVSVNGEPRVLDVSVRGRLGSVETDGTLAMSAGTESTTSVEALSAAPVVATSAVAQIDAGFEGAVPGTQLTNFANSGFWRVQGTGAEGLITVSDARAVSGTRSAHVSGSSPSTSRVLLANLACATPTGGVCSSPPPTRTYASTYLYVPTPATGGNPPILMQLTNSTFHALGFMQYNSTRTGLALYRYNNVLVGNAPWVTNQWMRLDYEYDSTNSTQRLRLFWGDSLHDRNPSSAQSDTGTVAAAGGPNSASPSFLYVGSWSNRPATNYYLDDFKVYASNPYGLGTPEAVAGATITGSGPAGITVRPAVTGADGVANVAIRVPAGTAPGTYQVTFTSGGQELGQLDVVVSS
jgi:hypothetical protein